MTSNTTRVVSSGWFQPGNACYYAALEVPPDELGRERIDTVGHAFKALFNITAIRGVPQIEVV